MRGWRRLMRRWGWRTRRLRGRGEAEFTTEFAESTEEKEGEGRRRKNKDNAEARSAQRNAENLVTADRFTQWMGKPTLTNRGWAPARSFFTEVLLVDAAGEHAAVDGEDVAVGVAGGIGGEEDCGAD